mgnify:CR=1 FL=1
MYTREHIYYLNLYGLISQAFLRRKFKLTPKRAQEILNAIVQDHTNVMWLNKCMICIEDARNAELCCLISIKPNSGRKSKYKRVRII